MTYFGKPAGFARYESQPPPSGSRCRDSMARYDQGTAPQQARSGGSMSERGSQVMTRSSFVERVPVGEAAEAYLLALTAQGVDCLFLNPGTDTFPVQEAAAKLRDLGTP